jgi:glycosyltransferase involved in cell wall biosynthesis
MTPLRLAIFHTSLPSPDRKVGGVEASVHRLATTFAEHPDVDVTVLSCGCKPPDANYRFRQIFPFAMRHRLGRLFILPFLLNFFDFRGYDVVHLHGDDWFWFWRRVPTVRTMHGSALREAQNTTRLGRKLIQYVVFPLEQLSVWLASVSVAVGRDTKRLYGCEEIVGNGVDLTKFKTRPKAPGPTIVYIGLWEGRKRGQFAYQVFTEQVLPRFPKAQLHMISDRADTHCNVILHAHPDDAMLAKLLAEAWVFCYPSVYEGFGIPYIEAMASGTAIVTSQNAGAAEVLQDGRCGVISDDDAFADNLMRILADADLRRNYEARGLARAREFSADAIAERYLQLYSQVAYKWA